MRGISASQRRCALHDDGRHGPKLQRSKRDNRAQSSCRQQWIASRIHDDSRRDMTLLHPNETNEEMNRYGGAKSAEKSGGIGERLMIVHD